jgi:hypothetical protein
MGPLRLVDAWFGQLRSSWEMRLDRLAEAITEEETTHDD